MCDDLAFVDRHVGSSGDGSVASMKISVCKSGNK